MLDGLVYEAPLPPRIEFKIVSIPREQYCGNLTAPRISNFEIDVRICQRKISNNESCARNSMFHPIQNIAGKCRKVGSLAKQTCCIDCALDAVMKNIVHFRCK